MAKPKITTGPTAAQVLFLAMCRQHGLPEPVPEYQFHSKRKWRFDYSWFLIHRIGVADCKVALEIEGGLFGRGKKCSTCGRSPVGAHSSISNLLETMEKYNEAAIAGWVVIRCIPRQVQDGSVFELLKRVLT